MSKRANGRYEPDRRTWLKIKCLKNQLHEVVDGPLVTLLTEAKGDLDTIPIDWVKMGLPDPTIELDKLSAPVALVLTMPPPLPVALVAAL